jgi:hypothetical protein
LPTRARSLPLSLSRCSVGPSCRCRSFPRALSLSLCPAIPTYQSSLTSRPRSPYRGRTHVRAFSGHVPAPVPLLSLATCSPTSPHSFAPSAKPSRPLSRSAHTCRELRHRPPMTTACSMAAVAPVPHPAPRLAPPYCQLLGTPFGVPFPSLLRPVHAHWIVSCAARAPLPSTRGSIAPPSFSKRPRVRTRGEHPSHAFILPSITSAPAQLLTGVSCVAAEPFPPRSALSGAPVPGLRPRSCSPCCAERV